jgi:nicotinamidase/pyrazinamidase
MGIEVTDRDVLLVVDVQNDFCDGGALAVPGGQDVVPVIHRIAGCFRHAILTQDWHPPDHHSFASHHPGRQPFDTIETSHGAQMLWPDHCVQGSLGAAFHPHLQLDNTELILRKGFRPDIDSYSAFLENDHRTRTGLTAYLHERELTRIFITGLAYDVCVRYSAIHAKAEGFETYVIEDACRGIDQGDSVHSAKHALREAGVHHITSADLL